MPVTGVQVGLCVWVTSNDDECGYVSQCMITSEYQVRVADQ